MKEKTSQNNSSDRERHLNVVSPAKALHDRGLNTFQLAQVECMDVAEN